MIDIFNAANNRVVKLCLPFSTTENVGKGNTRTTLKNKNPGVVLSTITLLLATLIFGLSQAACLTSRPSRTTEKSTFHVLAFYTAQRDLGHISFVQEANRWLASIAAENHFTYDSTDHWERLHPDSLKDYQVVLFLDTRPEVPAQRQAFEQYMKNGGAWMGFHFAAFALTPSDYPQNWDWYHEEFLGSGPYRSNTWRPTSAVLRVEDRTHPATRSLPATFTSAPNEWYRWENDLRTKPDIQILLSIDPVSFPLGTGPKPHEIWHTGYYPVVWTNRRYRMLYFNMGHNDMDYEGGTNLPLSGSFRSRVQNELILNGLRWLGTGK